MIDIYQEISQEYFRHIVISAKSLAYFRHNSGQYQVYLTNIRHISGDSQEYPRNSSDISFNVLEEGNIL